MAMADDETTAPAEAQENGEKRLPKEVLDRIPERYRDAEDPLAAWAEGHRNIVNAYTQGQQRWHESQSAAQRPYEAPQYQPQGGPVAADWGDDETLSTRILEKPSEVLRQIEERAVDRAKRELVSDLSAAQQAQNTWNQFYISYPDLQEHDDLVRGMLPGLAADPDYLASQGNPAELQRVVATRVRQRIARFRGEAARPAPPRPASGSGGSLPPVPGSLSPEDLDDEHPKNLAEYRKLRAEAFRR